MTTPLCHFEIPDGAPHPDVVIDYDSPPSREAVRRALKLKEIADRYSASLPPEIFAQVQDNAARITNLVSQ